MGENADQGVGHSIGQPGQGYCSLFFAPLGKRYRYVGTVVLGVSTIALPVIAELTITLKVVESLKNQDPDYIRGVSEGLGIAAMLIPITAFCLLRTAQLLVQSRCCSSTMMHQLA